MAKSTGSITKWSSGISNSDKEGPDGSFAWSRSIEFRADAKKITLLPKSAKDSGSTVTDLPMWGTRLPVTDDAIFYGNAGNLYRRTSAGVWSLERTAPNSSGNGLEYFGEDTYLYYPQNKSVGRYGPTYSGATPQWYDSFLESEGGAPTNTNSLQLLSASSQLADRADTASLSITGDLTLEAYVSPTTLPTLNNTMTLVSKWDESGATRSYIMDIKCTSASSGSGSDGALTISGNTTEAPIDSACGGTLGTTSFTATNASFAAGQKILIHQSRGTGAGTYQVTEIAGYTAGTITTTDALNYSYSGKAQVRVLKQYTNVTINSGITYTCKAWDGTVGGILGFLANGTVTVTGSISAAGGNASNMTGGTGGGFRGGNGVSTGGDNTKGYCGEGTGGDVAQLTPPANNGNGGGNGRVASSGSAGGGGGGNGTVGSDATGVGSSNGALAIGIGGSISGANDLTTMTFGGGGGGGAEDTDPNTAGGGGAGGGIIVIFSNDMTITGSVSSNGGNGGTGTSSNTSTGGGGGAGGSIIVKAVTATLGTNKITANGGTGHVSAWNGGNGGNGGNGRVAVYYGSSYTGTSTPTLNAYLDSTLSNNTGYQLRLGVSSTGSNSEYLTKTLNVSTSQWTLLSATWASASATATFYQDAVSLGTSVGTLTAIHNNASRFAVGANKNGAGSYANFFNGLVDDARVWNTVRSGSQIAQYFNTLLLGTESFLQGYWSFNGVYTDSTANANDLAGINTPVFVTSVPFSGVTTRSDQDQSDSQTGQVYTLATSIVETAANKKSFVPARDPQKSIRFYVSAKGTGNWTVTIHDGLNRTIATSTVTNANLTTGFYEFIYSSVWRPVIGATYHAHITSTVADGTARTGTVSDLSTADYATFFQILVNDIYHPAMQFVNFVAIGNERYLATYDGQTYNPMRLTLPSGYRIRCLALWREYLAIGVWRGSTITDYDEGKVFFWDGTSETYNFFIDVPEGGINSLLGTKGLLYIWAGYSGDLLGYEGGTNATKIRRLPKVSRQTYTEILPGAVVMWRALLMFGVGNSSSTTVERGVYSWGSLDQSYPPSLGYDYPISTGNRTLASVKVGSLEVIGQKLFVGWQDNVSYGVDVIDPTGSPFTTGTVESLISDFNKISQQKLPLVLRADFDPLVSGESVTIKYKADRQSDWNTVQTTVNTVGATEARLIIRQRVRELQAAVDFGATGTTSPTLLGVSLETDNLENEKSV